ncbi:hypothetical protein Hanom_Chr13g01208411 [Helianthus anomalus]
MHSTFIPLVSKLVLDVWNLVLGWWWDRSKHNWLRDHLRWMYRQRKRRLLSRCAQVIRWIRPQKLSKQTILGLPIFNSLNGMKIGMRG